MSKYNPLYGFAVGLAIADSIIHREFFILGYFLVACGVWLYETFKKRI